MKIEILSNRVLWGLPFYKREGDWFENTADGTMWYSVYTFRLLGITIRIWGIRRRVL